MCKILIESLVLRISQYNQSQISNLFILTGVCHVLQVILDFQVLDVDVLHSLGSAHGHELCLRDGARAVAVVLCQNFLDDQVSVFVVLQALAVDLLVGQLVG